MREFILILKQSSIPNDTFNIVLLPVNLGKLSVLYL